MFEFRIQIYNWNKEKYLFIKQSKAILQMTEKFEHMIKILQGIY